MKKNKLDAVNLLAEKEELKAETLLSATVPAASEEKKESSPLELEYKNMLQRLQAEFDNYRQRTNIEKSRLVDYGREEILTHLMEIYEQIEKATGLNVSAENLDQFLLGFKLIKQAIEKKFSSYEVERVATIGQPFNAFIHEAVSSLPVADESDDGKIIAEVSPGFMRKKMLLTAAKVVVGKKVESA